MAESVQTEPVLELATGRPSPRLTPYVAWYSGYRQSGVQPGTHRGLPSPFLTLILTLDHPLVIAGHPDPAQRPASFEAMVGGLHCTPATIAHDGRQSGVQVALHPLGARALLGFPAGELASLDLPLDVALGARATALRERLLGQTCWQGRFEVLDAAFEAWLDDDRGGGARQPPELTEAWRLLLCSGGSIAVRELARQVGWGERHLLDRFRRDVGLTPKAAARVVRFDRARRRLFRLAADGRAPTLAALAAAAGYFDQAHLARDFRDLAGCSPSRLLADELRYVQVVPLPGDEDWSA